MTAEKCTKKRDARAKLLFCQSKPIALVPFSLPSPSSLVKLPNVSDRTLRLNKPTSRLILLKTCKPPRNTAMYCGWILSLVQNVIFLCFLFSVPLYHIQKYGIKRLKARIRVSLSIWRVSYSFRANTFFSLYDSRCRVKRLFSYHIFRVIYYNRKPFSKSQALIVVSFSQHLFISCRLSFLCSISGFAPSIRLPSTHCRDGGHCRCPGLGSLGREVFQRFRRLRITFRANGENPIQIENFPS